MAERRKLNVSEWINAFVNDEFTNGNFNTQVGAGWYDWFCKTTSLRNKTYRMGSIIKQLKKGGKIDFENWYVWFKNNCPLVGPLYDDFRFADIETGDVQFTICIDDKRSEHKYEVWGRKNNFDGPIACFDSSRELVKWLNQPW